MKLEDTADMLVKLVVCGESGVGKTNLIYRYIQDRFEFNSKSTIGIEFYSKRIIWNKLKVDLQVFDTVGQEKYRSVSNSFFKMSQGVLLVYDVTQLQSFEKLTFWKQFISQNTKPSIPVLLIGNKIDLASGRRVTTEKGSEFGKENGFYFLETSAKTNQNDCVSKAFELIFNQMCLAAHEELRILDNEIKELSGKALRIDVGNEDVGANKRCCI